MSHAPYRVELKRSAEKELRRLPGAIAGRVMATVRSLAFEPHPPGCRRLQGSFNYRIRVADYRVIYSIDDRVHIVAVQKIGHRRDIYRGL